MQKYQIDFFRSRNIEPEQAQYKPCEKCRQKNMREIHHITQSLRGKRKHNQDGSDLIGLCLDCHKDIHSHNTYENRQILLETVQLVIYK